MPRRIFKKYLPSSERVRQTRSLGAFAKLLGEPGLWHLNRRSVSMAVLVGAVCALLPIPLQMLPALLLAVWLKCNLPLTIVIVWTTNPLTYVPVFYFTYRVGARLLDMPVTPPDSVSFVWLLEQMLPLWVGSLTCGVTFGVLGMLLTRLLWRLAVVRRWEQRRLLRRANQAREGVPPPGR